MSKFKKKDLVKYFDEMCLFLANHHWTKGDERAIAIREMIQKPEGLPKKRALTVDEIISKYPEIVRILLSELVQKLDALQQKSEVTEEFVGKWNQVIAKRVNVQMKKDFMREEIGLVYPGTENLTQMLEEAGVEVKKKK